MVLDVGEIDDVSYLVTLSYQMPPYHVKSNRRLGVAHVAVIIRVNAADVHSHFLAFNGLEFFHLACHRILHFQGHFHLLQGGIMGKEYKKIGTVFDEGFIILQFMTPVDVSLE
jgi:hypothetical protein